MEFIEIFSEDLINGIRAALREQVVSIILYGSVARGTQAEESDVDVAVILKTPLDAESEDKLSDFVVDLNLKYDKVFSVIDIEENTFEKWGAVSPFYRNVKKEGIVLWKAA